MVPDNTPTSVLLFRFHHALFDGVGMFHLLTKMITPKSKKLTKEMCTKLVSPIRYLRMPYDFLHTCHEESRAGSFIQDKKIQTTLGDTFSPSEAASHVRFHISDPIPFSVIRQLGVRHGVSGTAVMHSAILGAVRSSFFAHVASSSTTVRVETTLLPPWKRDRLLGNNVTHGRYTAAIGEVDARKRLIRTHEALRGMKESTFPVTSALISNALSSLPRPILKQINKLHEGHERIFIGNMIGPEEKPKFCGYQSKDVSLMSGFCATYSGIIFGIITFGDTMKIGVFGNRNLLPRSGQAEEITRAFMQELDDLQIEDCAPIC
ncbi:uncharacterized protein LOC118433949 [Folsomia candida]|nr:uncharacterized protein LOC118433949 [Folsomia candida]